MRPRTGRARPKDAGESLVELLVSITIFGIAVVAILGALSMSASSSSLHEGQAKAQNLLRNWAEEVSAAPFQPCAGPDDIGLPSAVPAALADLQPQVLDVAYWNKDTLDFFGTCSGPSNSGVHRVTLSVDAPSSLGNFTQSLDVVVRKPCPTVNPC